MPKRGGRKNRQHNPTSRISCSRGPQKRGNRSVEAENKRNAKHQLVKGFKSAASSNLFKTVLPNKLTKEDNHHRLSAEVLLRAEADTETFHEDVRHPSGTPAGKGVKRPSSSTTKPASSGKQLLRPPGFDAFAVMAAPSSSSSIELDSRAFRGIGRDTTKPVGWTPKSLRADAEKQRQALKYDGGQSCQTWASKLA